MSAICSKAVATGRLAASLALSIACTMTPPIASDEESMTEGEKNLAAIRAILREYPPSSPHRSTDGSQAAGTAVRPFEGPVVVIPSATVDRPHPDGFPPLLVRPSARISPGRSSAQDFKVTIPWKPPVPSPILQQEPFRPVPPYFHPIPSGLTSPGPLRCVPDFFGGQRCRGQ